MSLLCPSLRALKHPKAPFHVGVAILQRALRQVGNTLGFLPDLPRQTRLQLCRIRLQCVCHFMTLFLAATA